MPKKHTFDLIDEVEAKWKAYESKYPASFSKMANRAIDGFLTKQLGRK